MTKEEYRALLNQVQLLSTEEQLSLLEDIIEVLKNKSRPQHNILEFKGMAKEAWEGVDVDEYIRESRGSHGE